MPKANDDEKIDVNPPTNLEKAHDKDKVEAHDRENADDMHVDDDIIKRTVCDDVKSVKPNKKMKAVVKKEK